MKRIMRTAALIALAGTSLSGCISISTPRGEEKAIAPADMSAEEAKALYHARYERYQNLVGAGLDGYDTLESLGGTDAWKPLAQGDSTIPADVLASARAYAQSANSSAFMVWHKGKLVEQSFFQGRKEASPVVSKSLAKPLSVIAVGRALANGSIGSLDEPVSKYITEWQNTPYAVITIRQLLGMRSGLLPQGPAPTADHILNRAYLDPFHDEVIIKEYPLVDVPGSRYEYSNANGDLIAPLLERATGVSYETWIAEQVLTPLGARGGEIWMNRPGGTPHSGCCALMPADSYLRLGILLAHDGLWEGKRLLPEGFVTQMKTSTPQNPHAGLGVYLGSPYIEWRGAAHPDVKRGRAYHSEPYLAEDLFLFDGNSNQVVYIVPSEDLVILRTGNAPSVDVAWDNAKLPNMILKALKRP